MPPGPKPDRIDPRFIEPVHQVPMMGEHRPIQKPKAWAVSDIELEEVIEWLHEALHERWPNLDPMNLKGYLWSAARDPERLFIRTTNTVGVFFIQRDVFEYRGVVYEKFVRSREKANEEQVQLYQRAKQWAIDIKARRMVLGLDSDVGMVTHVLPALGSLSTPMHKGALYILNLIEE